MTITNADVRRAAAELAEVARQAGLWSDETVAYVLSEGSPTYGRTWRLNAMHAGSSAHYRPDLALGDEILGWNKREAFDTLSTRTSAILRLVDFKSDWEALGRVVDQAAKTKRVDWSLWLDTPPWSEA